ncbi:MAG: lamin tail domain-containing protein [Candidatus Heimdallarchaeaceae archaeon]
MDEDLYANEVGSLCGDMTAGQVLAEANKILAGQSSGFSPSAINECLTEINERFVDGLTQKITPYESTWREITIIKESSLNFQHDIKVEQTSGDTDLCQALTVNAHLNGTSVYSGSLLNFVYGPTVFSNSTNQWKLYIGLPLNAPLSLQNKTCEFKYIITGWQEGISLLDSGFFDVEEISDSIDSGNWDLIVLNEFLPNPEGIAYEYDFGDDDSLMSQGEWVELYNNSNASYDLSGWYIWDASSDNSNKVFITSLNTSPANTIISAKSWLVVYMNKEMLDNTGDTVKLFNNTGTLVDLYTYTGIAPPNKSYARIPDGSANWVDPIPTPGGPNIIESEDIIFETIVAELNEEIINNEVLLVEEGLEPESIDIEANVPEEELIIIDDLFLASPPQNALDFQLDEELIVEEEILFQEEPVVDEDPIVEEVINEEVNTDLIPIEGTINKETAIEEPLVDEETLIIEEPVVEEIVDQVVDETIINDR